MNSFSIKTCLLVCLCILCYLCLQEHVAAIEIIIGGGSGSGPVAPSPDPDNPDCPPPPPPVPLCPPPPTPRQPPPHPPPTPRQPPPHPPPTPRPPPLPQPSPPPPLSSPFNSSRLELVYHVIQNFKLKIKDDPFGITKSWNGYDICAYKGFSCDKVPGYNEQGIAGVGFNGFRFGGPQLTLDGFIDKLEDLAVFHANSNNFTGRVPKRIADLKYLFELDLSNNKFESEFPMEVLGAKKLVFLDLRFNTFSGIVPPQVFNLYVAVLFINNNRFIQKLPDNLGDSPAIYQTFANNKFIGPIPSSIGRAAKTLKEVLFLNNQLSGCLPYQIGLLRNATVFDVSFNQLRGPIPLSFGCLAKMEILVLARNQFSGTVPDSLCRLASLRKLSLSYNYFTQVDADCRKLIAMKVLDVSMNCIYNLPNQRPVAECDKFFSSSMSCPDPESFSRIPCKPNALNALESSEVQHAAPSPEQSPSFSSYDHLSPQKL